MSKCLQQQGQRLCLSMNSPSLTLICLPLPIRTLVYESVKQATGDWAEAHQHLSAGSSYLPGYKCLLHIIHPLLGIRMRQKHFHILGCFLEVQCIFLPIPLLSIFPSCFLQPLTHRPTCQPQSKWHIHNIHQFIFYFKKSRQPLPSNSVHWEDFPSPLSYSVLYIGCQSWHHLRFSLILLVSTLSLLGYHCWGTFGFG